MKTGRSFAALVSLALGLVASPSLADVPAPDKPALTSAPVAAGVSVLMGEGGNIGVLAGEDGVLLVDAPDTPPHRDILAAVTKISGGPIRFLVCTHWHWDHTGDNEPMGKAGVLIVAHDSVRQRLSSSQLIEYFHAKTNPSPRDALPVVTFSDTVTLHFDGEDVLVFHVPSAHTDGDSVVQFRKANVVQMGDLFFSETYPFIDIDNGGSLDGMIAAADQVLQVVNPDTKIIPGHGHVSNAEELREYRDMLFTLRDRITNAINAGNTLEQVLAAKPSAEFDARRKGPLPADDFVTILYQDLARRGR